MFRKLEMIENKNKEMSLIIEPLVKSIDQKSLILGLTETANKDLSQRIRSAEENSGNINLIVPKINEENGEKN